MPSIKYNNVYIKDYYSIASNKETQSNIKYDYIIPNNYNKEKTYEQAEISMQKQVIDNLLNRNNNKIDLIIGGDLSNQIAISNYTLRNYNISYLGCYSACSTFTEELIIASQYLENKSINECLVITSSHRECAERQFRYPIEYGSPKLKRSTTTATGCVGTILTNTKSNLKLSQVTIGKVIDYNIKDSNNLGASMAPAAVDTLITHLKDNNIDISYYDLVVTGDLGRVGKSLFIDLLNRQNIKLKSYIDCGSTLYKESCGTSGSSGPVTLPLVLMNKILKNKNYHKILVLGTGALHSPTLLNQKESIPSISHAISIEVLK